MLPNVAVAFSALALCGVDAAGTSKPKHHKHKECPTPVDLIQNPSFDDPNAAGVYDGSPWILEDVADPVAVSITNDPDVARTGDYYAFFDITKGSNQLPAIRQSVAGIEVGKQYQLTYYVLLHQGQPTADDLCGVTAYLNGLGASTPDLFIAPEILDRYSTRQLVFAGAGPTDVAIGVSCFGNAGAQIQVAVDDVSLYEFDPKRPPPEE